MASDMIRPRSSQVIIYSWNMLFRNRELERAFDFIARSDFDIFCLQEVPGPFLDRLRALPVFVAAAPETDRAYRRERSTQYVVILSRHSIRQSGKIPLPYRDQHFSLRTKLFTRMMFALRLWVEGLGNRHALFADIETPQGIVRVINLHISLTHPAWRLEEFERAMLERDPSLPTVVCGDFNILEKPHIAPLNWLMGGTIADTLRYARERTLIEKRFVAHELANALRGESTHALSCSQLDHILVSRSFAIRNATVLPDCVGSDHHPIRVEIA